MALDTLLWILLGLSLGGYFVGRRQALREARGDLRRLPSLPVYYGYYLALWILLPALGWLLCWLLLQNSILTQLLLLKLPEPLRQLPPARLELLLDQIVTLASRRAIPQGLDPDLVTLASWYRELYAAFRWFLTGGSLAAAIGGGFYAYGKIGLAFRARPAVERIVRKGLFGCSAIAIFTTVGIVLSLLFEALRFFEQVSPWEFLFGLHWSPQISLRADQVAPTGQFGFIPLLVGTFLIAFIALAVATPIGIFAAIYLAEYAHPTTRALLKPAVEILAGIPTVVYGFFAVIFVSPLLVDSGAALGIRISSESALGAGVVMGIMLIPFIFSLTDDALIAVPKALRDGSLALGATSAETIRHVVLPAALPGIAAGLLLALSRALGETMIVVMAAGMGARLTLNPLEAVTTITVQIVALLVGDQEFDNPKTLAAFALGLVLFLLTLLLNLIALHVVRRYREQYE